MQLVWAVRKVTPIQAKYIRMFFGDDAVPLVQGEAGGYEPHGTTQ